MYMKTHGKCLFFLGAIVSPCNDCCKLCGACFSALTGGKPKIGDLYANNLHTPPPFNGLGFTLKSDASASCHSRLRVCVVERLTDSRFVRKAHRIRRMARAVSILVLLCLLWCLAEKTKAKELQDLLPWLGRLQETQVSLNYSYTLVDAIGPSTNINFAFHSVMHKIIIFIESVKNFFFHNLTFFLHPSNR